MAVDSFEGALRSLGETAAQVNREFAHHQPQPAVWSCLTAVVQCNLSEARRGKVVARRDGEEIHVEVERFMDVFDQGAITFTVSVATVREEIIDAE